VPGNEFINVGLVLKSLQEKKLGIFAVLGVGFVDLPEDFQIVLGSRPGKIRLKKELQG
jgi:hypothetical protein